MFSFIFNITVIVIGLDRLYNISFDEDYAIFR
jgi:hypothetical protein